MLSSDWMDLVSVVGVLGRSSSVLVLLCTLDSSVLKNKALRAAGIDLSQVFSSIFFCV